MLLIIIFGALSFPSSLVHKTDVTPAILSSDFVARVQSDFMSAFEVRTLWRYTDMFIIIIVNNSRGTPQLIRKYVQTRKAL